MNTTSDLRDRLNDVAVPPLRLEAIVARGRHLRRRRLAATTLGSVMAAGLITVGFLAVSNFIRSAPDQPRMQPPAGSAVGKTLDVFLKDNITARQRNNVFQVAHDLDGATNIRYVSKRAAYREFKKYYRDRPEYWENLPMDALPARFVVTFDDAADAEAGHERLQDLKGIDDVRRF